MAKLVRDKIPEIIRKDGGNPLVYIADDKEYLRRLRNKLKEEVGEFLEEDNMEELADILEVIDAICACKDWKKEYVNKLKLKKRVERGGFRDKLILK